MEDMVKRIVMKCNTCGNDQFSIVDESIKDLQEAPGEAELKCSDCGLVVTKEQLIQDNSANIHANVDDLKEDFMVELRKRFKRGR
jgi:uncharacterized Zn finger protein